MSLSIRLARAGAHKKPFYRVVVADQRKPRDGRFIEKIGTYDPLLTDKQKRVHISTERAQHWMARGAQPSRRVALFLHEAGVGDKPAIPVQTKKSLPRRKEQERRAAEQQKSQQPSPEKTEQTAQTEQAAKPAEAASAPSSQEKPQEDEPQEEKLQEDKPQEDKPQEEKLQEDKPQEDDA